MPCGLWPARCLHYFLLFDCLVSVLLSVREIFSSWFPCCYRLEKSFPLGLHVVICKRSGCMSSPRQEKVRSLAAKKMEAASEALLKAREAGEGPVLRRSTGKSLGIMQAEGCGSGGILDRIHHLRHIWTSPPSNWPGTGGLCWESCKELSLASRNNWAL